MQRSGVLWRAIVPAGALAGLLFSCSATSAPAPTLEAFFRPAPDAAEALDPAGIYPQGRRLLFTAYSIRGTKGDWARAGFTAIGPYYGAQAGHGQFAPHANVADAAKALGVKCLYRLGMDIPFLKEHKLPPDAEITRAITEEVRAVAGRPEIAIWNITPEELRYWRTDEMHYLKLATDAIRAADPKKRPIFLYEPNNRGAEALSRTLPMLDFSGKGMYANNGGMKEKRVWVRWSVEQEVKAIAKVKPSAVPLSVLWMAGNPDPAEVPKIAAWTRHDVYLSLVSGVKGIVIWSGFRRAGFTTFDNYLNGYAAAAAELNGKLGLGQVFLFGEKRDDLQVAVTGGPATLDLDYSNEKNTYPSVAHLDVAYGSDRYLFLVNSAGAPVTLTVTGLPSSGVVRDDVLAGGAAAPVADGKVGDVLMAPLEVKVWRFRRADG